MNRGLVIAGAILLAVSIIVPVTATAGADDWDNIVFFFVFTFFVSPFLFIGGIVMLIAGLVSGRQQQQQQVVIMTNPHAVAAPSGAAKACRRCRSRIALSDRFCNACGAPA